MFGCLYQCRTSPYPHVPVIDNSLQLLLLPGRIYRKGFKASLSVPEGAIWASSAKTSIKVSEKILGEIEDGFPFRLPKYLIEGLSIKWL